MANAAERQQMTAAEYLVFEREAPAKHEYVAGEVFAISGASLRHNAIVANRRLSLTLEVDAVYQGVLDLPG